jgi:hypothetical protein
MSSIGKVMMARTDAERAWYEDQLTVNMAARSKWIGNSQVVVIDGGTDGITILSRHDFVPGGLDRVRETCKEKGWRMIEGSILFTAKDNPRPYKAPK